MERGVMRKLGAFGDEERAIAALVASELGCEVTRVVRADAFATNAAYEVDAGRLRFVVKTSAMHDAIRAEAWASARGAEWGCPAPAILKLARLGADDSMSALIMSRISGRPITAGHPTFRDVGIRLRRLHETRFPGVGWLAEASWDERGDWSLPHRPWLALLRGICHDARSLMDSDEGGASVAGAAAAIEARADALAAVEIGSLCHGDLKPAHIFVGAGRLAGVIDWGDAVV